MAKREPVSPGRPLMPAALLRGAAAMGVVGAGGALRRATQRVSSGERSSQLVDRLQRRLEYASGAGQPSAAALSGGSELVARSGPDPHAAPAPRTAAAVLKRAAAGVMDAARVVRRVARAVEPAAVRSVLSTQLNARGEGLAADVPVASVELGSPGEQAPPAHDVSLAQGAGASRSTAAASLLAAAEGSAWSRAAHRASPLTAAYGSPSSHAGWSPTRSGASRPVASGSPLGAGHRGLSLSAADGSQIGSEDQVRPLSAADGSPVRARDHGATLLAADGPQIGAPDRAVPLSAAAASLSRGEGQAASRTEADWSPWNRVQHRTEQLPAADVGGHAPADTQLIVARAHDASAARTVTTATASLQRLAAAGSGSASPPTLTSQPAAWDPPLHAAHAALEAAHTITDGDAACELPIARTAAAIPFSARTSELEASSLLTVPKPSIAIDLGPSSSTHARAVAAPIATGPDLARDGLLPTARAVPTSSDGVADSPLAASSERQHASIPGPTALRVARAAAVGDSASERQTTSGPSAGSAIPAARPSLAWHVAPRLPSASLREGDVTRAASRERAPAASHAAPVLTPRHPSQRVPASTVLARFAAPPRTPEGAAPDETIARSAPELVFRDAAVAPSTSAPKGVHIARALASSSAADAVRSGSPASVNDASSVAAPALAEPPAAAARSSIDIERVAQQVSRIIARQLEVEAERRGGRPWS